MLELMARGGMRVGEVLKLMPKDIEGRKTLISDPKSGKEAEVVFIPQKVANRLKAYIRDKKSRFLTTGNLEATLSYSTLQKKSKPQLFPFIFFLRADEHLKATTLRDPNILWSPVAGLRPLRSRLSFTQNLPNPLIRTFSPLSSLFLIISSKDSTSLVDLDLEYPRLK